MSEPIPAYGALIADPQAVCDDWVYRAVGRLPGPSAPWAVAIAAAAAAITTALHGVGAPIEHVRSTTEQNAPYLFTSVTLVYFLVMPILFASSLQCFDRLRPSMVTGPEETAANRLRLRSPSARFQTELLLVALAIAWTTQEISSSRFSRFASGDWNALDVWLVFAASAAQWTFLWMMGMVIYRAVWLGRVIGASVKPRLYDRDFGAPIAAFGIRAGLVFVISYFGASLVSAAMYDVGLSTFLPGLVGILLTLAFILVPGARLRRRIREAKRTEIARVSETIDQRTERPPLADVAKLRELVELLEYRREIDATREWPFDLRVGRAFVLYFLLIPFTWVASGLVELAIERMAAADGRAPAEIVRPLPARGEP